MVNKDKKRRKVLNMLRAFITLVIAITVLYTLPQHHTESTPTAIASGRHSVWLEDKLDQLSMQPIALAEAVPLPGSHEDWMQQAGITSSDFEFVSYIISHESGWCYLKWEGEIGYCPTAYSEFHSPYDTTKGFGLCQSTPAIKMQTVADNWQTDPITQLKWCNQYALGRYGSWSAAYDHWIVHHNW